MMQALAKARIEYNATRFSPVTASFSARVRPHHMQHTPTLCCNVTEETGFVRGATDSEDAAATYFYDDATRRR